MFRILYFCTAAFVFYFINYTYEYVPTNYKFIAAFIGGIAFIKVCHFLKIGFRISK